MWKKKSFKNQKIPKKKNSLQNCDDHGKIISENTEFELIKPNAKKEITENVSSNSTMVYINEWVRTDNNK